MVDKTEMGDFQTAQTLETFGFLPRFSQAEVYDQIEYLIRQGWTPSIEHEHPSQSRTRIGRCGNCQCLVKRI